MIYIMKKIPLSSSFAGSSLQTRLLMLPLTSELFSVAFAIFSLSLQTQFDL